MDKIKNCLYALACAIIIELITIPLRGYVSYMASGVVAYTLYFISFLYCVTKEKAWVVLCAMLLGWGFVNLPFRIFYWPETLISLPSVLMHILGIFTGYLFGKVKKCRPISILISSVVLCILFYTKYELWIHYVNFGTFSGRVEQIIDIPILFQDNAGNNISLSDFKGKYVIFDFWNSSCSACIRAFPNVQVLYEKLSETKTFEIYSVFCWMAKRNEASQTGVDILFQRGYSFPILSMDINNPILQKMRINSFPTVIIFDPDGRLIFRGNIEHATDYLHLLIKDDNG